MDKHIFDHIKAIFFDVGDTLYTNEDLEKEYPKQLYKLIAVTKNVDKDQAKTLLKEATEKLKATEKHVTKVRAMKELGFTREQVHEAYAKVNPSHFLIKDANLETIISQLTVTYKLGIISNFKKAHTTRILEALGLSAQQFPLMVTEDIVKDIKPAPEPFEKALELAGCKPEECLYIGDSPSKDMKPAKKVGMMTILVRTHPLPEDMEHADASIASIIKLETLL